METWFVNHVLGLSLSVLLLALPRSLGAGSPGNSSTEPVTAGWATDGRGNTGNGPSESLSPSQRSLLTHTAHTHDATAGNFDTEQTKLFTKTSRISPESTNVSTEPLTSTLLTATEPSSSTSSSSISSSSSSISNGSGDSSSSSSSSSSSISSISSISISSSSSISNSSGSGDSSSSSSSVSSSSVSNSSDWEAFTNTDRMPRTSHAETLPQDRPNTTLQVGDATSLMSQTVVLSDSTYTTTISRAGERTLLSVTSSSNNTSPAFTENLSSHQPSSTWAVPPRPAETEGYTQSAPSTRNIGRQTTEQRVTQTFSETGSPAEGSGTQSLSGQANTTLDQLSSTLQETSDSTTPPRISEPSTDQSDVSMSSTPPFLSPAEGPANVSGTDQGSGSSVGTSTESSTGPHGSSPQNHKATEGLTAQTSGNNTDLGLTAAPSIASTSTSEINDSLTDMPMVTGILQTTLPVTVTERSQITEEDTFRATFFTTTTISSTTPPPPTTSSPSLSSIFAEYTSGSPTKATVPYNEPSTTVSTPDQHTSAPHPTHFVSPSQTQRPSTGMANPTKASDLQTEASTVEPRITTARNQESTTTYIHSTPTRSTEALHTTNKQPDRGATELDVTTLPTDAQTTKLPPTNPCVSNPCMNGGMCVSYKGPEYTCHCQQAWTGPTCNLDVDECEKYRCPAGSTCINTQGSFSCECPLGFDLKDGRTCTKAKTFLGTFRFSVRSYAVHDIQGELMHLLNVSLSVLRGYTRSTLNKNLSKIREHGEVRISVVNMFSISTNVTNTEVNNSIQMSLSNRSSSVTQRIILSYQYSYHTESLCEVQKTQCDKERSTCADNTGTAYCQCHQGYYKHNPDDLSCLECGDGYKLENNTCIPCMFGFGGFNCGNFYKLIAVVVSPAGGGLLLILLIALIVTCCKKDKNDINKIIFKSGDMQMSPYADFPKNNRISMEWGRETIEMQENGSTKNLLQMTDIYYSPALRNSDLERNGLYPFTGLPGSRHSCIYPAQWNPSFISDDSRRRDYF